ILHSAHSLGDPVRGAGELHAFEVAPDQVEDVADGDAALRPFGVVAADCELNAPHIAPAHRAEDAQLEAIQATAAPESEVESEAIGGVATQPSASRSQADPNAWRDGEGHGHRWKYPRYTWLVGQIAAGHGELAGDWMKRRGIEQRAPPILQHHLCFADR